MKILGSGKNFRFGRKSWVWAKIVGSGKNFMFGRKFWVWVKILCSGEKNVAGCLDSLCAGVMPSAFFANSG